jgi:Sulfatase
MPNSIDAQVRAVLPIPDQVAPHLTTYDAKDPDSTFPPITPLRPPEGAPNVLIVLIDDCGFGATSAFGGPVATPTFERLAGEGLRFTRFHTTALCSPTRAALLSGRNHHTVGMGGITDVGSDSATPVSDDYGARGSAFNGRVRLVQIDVGDDAQDADHLISPEERLRVAMARQ